jgi:hypothetical protein
MLPAALLAAFVCWLIEAEVFGTQRTEANRVVLEWVLKTSERGFAKVEIVEGNSINKNTIEVAPGDDGIARVRVAIPREGRYRTIRIGLLDRPAEIAFGGARVATLDGKWVREIPVASFCLMDRTTKIESSGRFPKTSQPPPQIVVDFDPFLEVGSTWNFDAVAVIPEFALLFAVFTVIFRCVFYGRGAGFWESMGQSCRRNPRKAVFASAVLGVLLSCFPIVFGGMSLVSAGSGVNLIYRNMPTVPMSAEEAGEVHEATVGSDVGATMWYHFPMAFQANRAVFTDGEIPLWNRYSWCGVPQDGQFLHMWGDPLYWLPIATGGASWAWDVRGIITRLLYAFGCGLLVLRTCGSLRVALVLTISACFHGFFNLRTAHAATYSFAYMPWVLLAWIEVAKAPSIQAALRWGGALIFASWMGLNGGAAKEPVLAIAAMNAIGAGILLFGAEPWKARLGKLTVMAWANVLLLLCSAPLWMPFLKSLREGVSGYQAAKVYQLQPALLIGMFDEIFQRQVVPNEYLLSAGANFLILLGALWSVASSRILRKSPVFLWCGLGALCGLAFVFGAVPASLLAKVPFLQNIYHFDMTFSFLLFTPLLVVAGFGLREMWNAAEDAEWRWSYVTVVLLFLTMIGGFIGFTEASHRVGLSVHEVGMQYFKSRFFIEYAFGISASLLVLPWLCRAIRRGGKWAPLAGAAAALALALMHFRMGMHLETSFDRYVYNPKSRYDFREMKSPGLEFLKQTTQSEPARMSGINWTLMPGFSIIPGLENICGPEPFETRGIHDLFAAIGIERSSWGWVLAVNSENYQRIQRPLDFIGVRYLVGDPVDAMPGAIVHSSDVQISESKTAWPRAFFADSAVAVAGYADIGTLVRTGDGKPFAAVDATVLKTHPELSKPSAAAQISPASNYRLTNNSTSFDIDSKSAGLAVLHETNVPGDIVAKVDGAEVPCLMVNGAFRGAWIPSAGRHRVEFTYAPRAWAKSLRVAGAGCSLVLLTVCCAIVVRRRTPIS